MKFTNFYYKIKNIFPKQGIDIVIIDSEGKIHDVENIVSTEREIVIESQIYEGE